MWSVKEARAEPAIFSASKAQLINLIPWLVRYNQFSLLMIFKVILEMFWKYIYSYMSAKLLKYKTDYHSNNN